MNMRTSAKRGVVEDEKRTEGKTEGGSPVLLTTAIYCKINSNLSKGLFPKAHFGRFFIIIILTKLFHQQNIALISYTFVSTCPCVSLI